MKHIVSLLDELDFKLEPCRNFSALRRPELAEAEVAGVFVKPMSYFNLVIELSRVDRFRLARLSEGKVFVRHASRTVDMCMVKTGFFGIDNLVLG